MGKRILALGVLLLLVFPALAGAADSSGGGLGGLMGDGGTGGGLSGLLEGDDSAGVLPDPAEWTGENGSVLQEAYLFSAGYVCTAYSYPLPEDDAFLESYVRQAELNGFSVSQQSEDGYEALRLSLDDGSYALLFPNVDGVMLLLVQEGMAFGAPEPEGFYLSMERNGRKLFAEFGDHETSCTEVSRSTGTSRSFEIMYYFERAEITLFTLRFPNYVQAGDEIYVTKDHLIDGLYLYTQQEGSLIFYDSSYDHQMVNSKDYFRLKITDMYETEDGFVIEGEFDGSFHKGETIYSNGSFRVLNDL